MLDSTPSTAPQGSESENSLVDRIKQDLALSGLVHTDLNIRVLENPERAATNTPFTVQGYVIPYYDMHGQTVPFYRVRLFDFDPKYKQPKETPSRLYFPKGFSELAREHNFVLFTEGEKKAQLAHKLGYPAVSVGGVDAWRNRVVTLPGDSELSQSKNRLNAKLPVGAEVAEDSMSPLAQGMNDLIDYLVAQKKHLIIIYDTDLKEKVKPQVQRAAAILGYELRHRGVEFQKIRQLILPTHSVPEGENKIGLDDFLVGYGKEEFDKLIKNCLAQKSAFPQHPNVREFINKRLQKGRLTRKEVQSLSTAVLSELDSSGVRLSSQQEKQMYYFDMDNKKLVQASFSSSSADAMSTSPFEQYLYRRFGIGPADRQLMEWVASQFSGEEPIEQAQPFRVLARNSNFPDSVVYQLSDSQYIRVSHRTGVEDLPGLEVYDNGENGVMFEADQVEPLDLELLLESYAEQAKRPSTCWWAEVLQEVRLQDRGKGRIVTALLYYMSPWLHRWRNTQLPVEMVLGEAGSGKSTLCELRLNIITGIPKLRNAPQDLKDWNASITNSGGLHVTDNLQLADKNLRQRLSDELCRLVTESNPTVEMRKYYTNADLINLPVRCTFAITAIQQPFMNADILQRAILIELDKSEDLRSNNLRYDSGWMNQQLKRYGGREAWIAHHLLTLHRFFTLVHEKWNLRYEAKHRLINLEQGLCLMAEVFDLKSDWIPDFLSGMTDRALTESDWAFEGLQVFCNLVRETGKTHKSIFATDISDWAQNNDEYKQCELLISARRLGRYLKTHKSTVGQMCGLMEDGTSNNRIRYKVRAK